jgi:hypothetical protein
MQVYQAHKQLTDAEKTSCNTLVKNYDDTTLKQKIVEWWNTKHPTNRVQINPDIYKIDLLGVDNPHFAIELEQSFSWKSHHRPIQFKVVRIPMRKAHYWLRKDVEAVFLQTNHDVTSCVLLTDDVIRNKYYNRIVKTNVGYKEHFLEYYTWQYHEIAL